MADENAFMAALMADNSRLRGEVKRLEDEQIAQHTRDLQENRRLQWAIYCMCKEAGGDVRITRETETREYIAGKEERLFIEWTDYDRHLSRVRITTVDEVPQYGVRVVRPLEAA